MGSGWSCCSVGADGTPGGDGAAEQGAGRWLSELFQGKRGLQVDEQLQAGLANPLWDSWAKLP